MAVSEPAHREAVSPAPRRACVVSSHTRTDVAAVVRRNLGTVNQGSDTSLKRLAPQPEANKPKITTLETRPSVCGVPVAVELTPYPNLRRATTLPHCG